MPFKNPTRLSFVMPTERVDSTSIDGPLSANVYMDGVQIVTYPSALNPGAEAAMLFSELGWEPTPGATHVLTVTAKEGALESAQSLPVEVQFVGKPQPPVGLSVSSSE